jgi:hypothetical protein
VNKFAFLALVFVLFFSACVSTTAEMISSPAVLETKTLAVTESIPSTFSPTATEFRSASPSPEATQTPKATTEIQPTPKAASIDQVIEFEMEGAFQFFWEQANTDPGSPGYGLIRDRFPGSEGISSIASVGFGLTAYVIGVEKGFISREAGYERASKTLDTLLAMDRIEGFYFHFIDMETGKRAWNSEISSIDTSILLMGVLAAGEYFGGEVKTKAKQIYNDVNWPWFLDESRNMFHMAYRPEEGFAGHWDFYAEQLMMYLLAAGSDTHPVDETPYYTFTRHTASYGDGKPFIHSWFGSLFTYQFSHAWIDFRGLMDKKEVNWFDNSVEASLAQVNFARKMDKKYITLGPDAWGLTACDGPNGYNGRYGAPPSGYDNKQHFIDDTIPPAGAIGSIIFVPEHAQRAMVHYYSFDKLKGKYGFFDAYNLSNDWYAADVIGIDKGISLLMLANFENDLVYQTMMKNEQILRGLSRLGFMQIGKGKY